MEISELEKQRILSPYYQQFATTLNSILDGFYNKSEITRIRDNYVRKAQITVKNEGKYEDKDVYQLMDAKLLYEDNVRLFKENDRLRDLLNQMKHIIHHSLVLLHERHTLLCNKVAQLYSNDKQYSYSTNSHSSIKSLE